MRLIKIVLLLCLALVVILLLALLPDHIRIRQLSIEVPQWEKVQGVIDAVPEQELPVHLAYLQTARQQTPLGELGHVVVIVSWADGKQFMIDAGMNRDEASKFGASLELIGAEPSQNFGPVEEQMGHYIDHVKGIAFTHLHSDHTVGLSAICSTLEQRGRQAVVFQTQAQRNLHTFFTKPGQELINDSSCEKHLLGDELVKAIPGFQGLFAIEAGGHTPGSTLYLVRTKNHVWLFAGDITNSMEAIHKNQGKGFAYSYLLVPEDTELLESWRLWLAQADQQENTTVLVAHDIQAFEHSELELWLAEEADSHE